MMKRILFFLIALSLFIATGGSAAEEKSVSLSVPDAFFNTICPQPVWKDKIVIWDGVVDRRSSKLVGLLKRRKKKHIAVAANPPLNKVMDRVLVKLFETCGMKLVKNKEGTAPELSVEIKEFYLGLEKRVFTGKGQAQSRIVFNIEKSGTTNSVALINKLDAKSARSHKLMKKTLDALLVHILEQVIIIEQLVNI